MIRCPAPEIALLVLSGTSLAWAQTPPPAPPPPSAPAGTVPPPATQPETAPAPSPAQPGQPAPAPTQPGTAPPAPGSPPAVQPVAPAQAPASGYPPPAYPPPGQPPPPGYYTPPPPLPPARIDDPEVENHDGFYFRVGIQVGLQAVGIDFADDAYRDLHLGGLASGLEIMLGGTPFDGGAIGVYLGNLVLRSERVRLLSDMPDRYTVTVDTGLFGMFLDVFPDPRANLHFGGSLTLLSHNLRLDSRLPPEVNDEIPKESAGLGLNAWAGQGFWISENWSIDGTLQLNASTGRSNDANLKSRSIAAIGVFSFLYH